MKTSILRRAMLAGAIATSSMIGIAAATPAHAPPCRCPATPQGWPCMK